MQRNVVLPIIGGVVAALVLVGVILILGHNHKKAEVALVSPGPTFSAEPSPTESASPSPSPTATPSGSPGATSAASSTPAATKTPTPTPTPRDAKDVNCADASDRKFCSKVDGTQVKDGNFSIAPANHEASPPPDGPTIFMKSTIRKKDNSTAHTGDAAGSIHVDVTVENKTSNTYHFPDREIVFEIYKDGKHFDTLTTHGAAFDLTPGGKMTGTFDRPLNGDGTYTWRARVWYFKK